MIPNTETLANNLLHILAPSPTENLEAASKHSLLEHAINDNQKHDGNRAPHAVKHQLLLDLPPTHALHYPPRPVRHARDRPDAPVRTRYRLAMTSQLLRDLERDTLGLRHDGSGVGESFRLGLQRLRVGKEALFAAAVGTRATRPRPGFYVAA